MSPESLFDRKCTAMVKHIINVDGTDGKQFILMSLPVRYLVLRCAAVGDHHLGRHTLQERAHIGGAPGADQGRLPHGPAWPLPLATVGGDQELLDASPGGEAGLAAADHQSAGAVQ